MICVKINEKKVLKDEIIEVRDDVLLYTALAVKHWGFVIAWMEGRVRH